ncbi:MAG: hypothetical protein WEF86_02570 [Gemmatimonadota bacterium]
MQRSKIVVLRDLTIFLIKLTLDGMKDIVLSPLAMAAAAADVVLPGQRVGHRFYAVLAMGEAFDRWLCLFGATERVTAEGDGLFGASRAGSASMLGRLEAIVLGHEETGEAARSTV